jgi:hypothetical protein
MRRFAWLFLSCMALGGCWQSKGSLYEGVKPATPFATGHVTETGTDELGKPLVQHFSLVKGVDGAYRMISTSRDKDYAGNGFLLRFLTLAGLPAGTYVYEAASLEHCDTRAGCDRVKRSDDRWYGLARLTTHGAEEIRPDCTKDVLAIAPSGIKDAEGACNFIDRATLERALLTLARKNPAVAFTYRFTP